MQHKLENRLEQNQFGKALTDKIKKKQPNYFLLTPTYKTSGSLTHIMLHVITGEDELTARHVPHITGCK